MPMPRWRGRRRPRGPPAGPAAGARPCPRRPPRSSGRSAGGRAAGAAAAHRAGVVTGSIVAPRDPRPTRVITRKGPNQGRIGAFPDGPRRPRRQALAMTSAPPPRPPAAGPPVEPPSWQPPPPPPGPPVRRPLRRSRTDKVIGGVSGGLAEYTGIDALLWRVGFVALTLAGGAGLIVYLLLWLLMPAGPPAGAGGPSSSRAASRAGPRSPVPGHHDRRPAHPGRHAALITSSPAGPRPPRLLRRRTAGRRARPRGRGVHRRPDGARAARRPRHRAVAGLVVSRPSRGGPGRVGDRTYRPSTADGVQPGYDIGVGDVTLDLAGSTSPTSTNRPHPVENGVGDLEVHRAPATPTCR